MIIDYVVPMVFEDDAEWREDYLRHFHFRNYRIGDNVRFRSWGNEHLLIQCIREFMPFVRTIHIILAKESQRKEWMDEENVHVVYHRDIIPEKYLPCFNSCTIEMFVPYIEGLAEHFIYGNDDMFPVSPMKEEDFFVDGLPVQRYEIRQFPSEPNIFHRKCMAQQDMVAGVFGKKMGNTWLHNGHNLAPILKSSALEVRDRFKKEVEEGICPYRCETSYNQYLYSLWQYFSGRYHEGRAKSTYISVGKSKEDVESVLRTFDGIVCVNDNESTDDVKGYAAVVRRAITYRLMKKSKIDYQIWVSYHKDELKDQFGLQEDEHHKLFATHKPCEKENINHLNPVYSEMVTMWYVWKNQLKSEYVGFEHYRRHLNIVHMPRKGECQVFKIYDLPQTVYEQYAMCHNVKDLDCVLGILDEKYGLGNKYTHYIKNSSRLLCNCTFLMKWEDFCAMCDFMFPILEEFTHACGIEGLGTLEEWHNKAVTDFGSRKTIYQRRVVSFLAERLISAWIYNNMKYNRGVDVAMVNYNTPKLVEAAIMSLNKRCPGCSVTVFDNSDTKPFKTKLDNVTVIDNTKGKIVDFEKMLAEYPDRESGDRNKSNFGSAKHCRSVEALFKYLPDGFILMDSDVLVKDDITKIVDTSMALCGEEGIKDGVKLMHPFLCWINVPMLQSNKVHYFNGEKMWALHPGDRYDTGAWVLEDVKDKNLPWQYVSIWKYITHLGHGSWRDKNADEWLEANANLWK